MERGKNYAMEEKNFVKQKNFCLEWKVERLDWIEQCFTSPPTQYRLYGRRFLQVKRPNQQYQSIYTKGTNSTQTNQTCNKKTWTQNTASPLFYNNMGWLDDGSHRGQGCQAWTAVGLPPRCPRKVEGVTYGDSEVGDCGDAIFTGWGEPGGEWTEWGWRNEERSWFHRWGDAYLKERLVICNEKDTAGA